MAVWTRPPTPDQANLAATSGASVPTLDEVLEGRAPAVNEPVRAVPNLAGRFSYSGGGYCVLQRAVADLTGGSYSTFVHASVLQPAGMRSATYTPGQDGHCLMPGWADGAPIPEDARTYPELAAAGLCCTPTDLVRFGLHLIQTVRGVGPHRPGVVTAMLRPHSETYTLGLELLNLPGYKQILGHAGSNRGFKSMFAIDLEAGAAAAVMVNDDRATLSSRAAALGAALHRAAG